MGYPLLSTSDELNSILDELRHSDERYNIASDQSDEIIIDYDVRKNSIYCESERVTAIYGIPQKIENAPKYLVRCGVVHRESAGDFFGIFRRIYAGERRASCILKTQTAGGDLRWTEISLATVAEESGEPTRAIGILRDVTAQHRAVLRNESKVQRRDTVVHNALLYYEADLTNHLILTGLENTLSQLHVAHTSNYEQASEALISHLVHPDDRAALRISFSAAYLLAQHAVGIDRVEIEYRHVDAKDNILWMRATVYLSEDPTSGIVYAYYYMTDMNDEKLRALQQQAAAERDSLTGLYNKAATERLIRDAIDRSCAAAGQFNAFLMVDLEGFAGIHEQLGQAFVDASLSEAAQRLQGICRPDDIAGRVGSNSFILFLKNLPDAEIVCRKAQEICDALHVGIAEGVAMNRLSGTIGVAIQPLHGASFDDLHQSAMLALAEAKTGEKDTWRLFDEDLLRTNLLAMPRANSEIGNGKPFTEHVIEYVFHILYEAKDLNLAINGVLELISGHFHFGRSYIFELNENDCPCYCTYEWHNSALPPFSAEMRAMSEAELRNCRLCFQSDGSYLLGAHNDPAFEETHAYPPLPGILTRLQFAFLSNGRFQGFIGFDRYEYHSQLSENDFAALQGVAHMLDVFLTEKHATDKLHESGMLHAVADNLRSCTYIIDPDTHELQFVNQNTRRIIPDALPGTLCYQTIRGRKAPCEDCPITKMLSAGLREHQGEMFLDRYELWAKIHTSLIKLPDGREYGLFNGYDFAEYKKHNGNYQIDVDAFTRDTTLYDALSLSMDDYIFICDVPKNLFHLPKAMVEEFDLPDQIIENLIPLWTSRIHENERDLFAQNIADLFSGKVNLHDQEYRVQNKNGIWVWLHCRGHLERDASGTPTLFAGVISNLGRQSKIDALSGMPNKYEFELQTRAKLAEHPDCGTLLLLGLDNFKYINNLYGWKFGDEVLHETAQRIAAFLPPTVQLYRLDGDTFGIFFVNQGFDVVNAYFLKLYDAFQQPRTSLGKRYRCTISGGCVTFYDRTYTPTFSSLFKQAQYALEFSKNEGKNRLSLFDNEKMSDKERKLTLISQLQDSVDNHCLGFDLHFQPQIVPTTQKVVSAEALLRWQSAQLGTVPPNEFIPLLEQTGLIHKVGRWVIDRVTEICNAWRERYPDFHINVNLSFVQLQDPTFLPYLTDLVESGVLNPQAIHLELTESCIADGSRSLTEAFETLRNLGFCIEMDDFGTGYSSLEILKNAPADVVKIDHAFVCDITRSDFDATFIQFIVSLCHSVGIRVCLEGVETWAEYYMVEPMQLDLIQGYLFGRPQSRADFEAHFLD